MSDRSLTYSSPSQVHHYRHGRRRWVPKGVMLLAVLFIVGLLTACQKAPSSLTGAIAVPADQSVAGSFRKPCTASVDRGDRLGRPVFAKLPSTQQRSVDKRAQLNVF